MRSSNGCVFGVVLHILAHARRRINLARVVTYVLFLEPPPDNFAARETSQSEMNCSLTVIVPSNAVSGVLHVYRSDAPMGSAEHSILVNGTPASLRLAIVSPFYKVAAGQTVTLSGTGFNNVATSNVVSITAPGGQTTRAAVTAASPMAISAIVPADSG